MRELKRSFRDFTVDDLPQTRKEVFFSRYKEHFSLLLKVGLVCLAIFIPIILVSYFKESYLLNALENLEEQTKENIDAIFFGAELIYGIMRIFALTLFAALFSGVVQILRQTLWDEPVFFGDDYKNGFQSNAFKFGVTGFLLATVGFLINLYSASMIRYVLNGVFIAFILPVAIWFALQGIYYKQGVISSVKNAEVLYLKTVPVTVLLLLFTIVPFWLVENFITLLIVRYLVLIALALFYIVPLTMCWLLYACSVFDTLVNKQHNPEIYRKGMKPECEEAQNDSSES